MNSSIEPRRRWTDKLLAEYAPAEVLAERVRRVEQSVMHEAELRGAAFASHSNEHRLVDQALNEYKMALADRVEQLNHLREEVMRERATYSTRDWSESQVRSINQ